VNWQKPPWQEKQVPLWQEDCLKEWLRKNYAYFTSILTFFDKNVVKND